jgi:hypothetical protein
MSVALNPAMFAGDREQQISGTVVEYNPGFLTIEDNKKERWDFHAELGGPAL